MESTVHSCSFSPIRKRSEWKHSATFLLIPQPPLLNPLCCSILGSDHFGAVLIGGRPVCHSQWDDNDAKVVCRQLGFPSNARAVAMRKGFFGISSTNYLINEVRCNGSELTIHDCEYRTMNNCGKLSGAGVACVDPGRLSLKGGLLGRDGNVYISDDPICDSDWDKNDAQVVCNSLYGELFEERGRVVPVFKATTG